MSNNTPVHVGPPVIMTATNGPPNMVAMQAGVANTAQANALAGLAGGNLKKRRQSKRAIRTRKQRSLRKKNKIQKRNKTNKKSSRRNKRKKMIGGVGEPIPYNTPMVPYNNGDSQIGDISKTLALAHASSSSQSVGDNKV